MEGAEAYRQFWDSLLPAYPISQGQFRLPIATSLATFPGLNLELVLDELEEILKTLLREHSSPAGAEHRLQKAGEVALRPLLTDEFTGVVRFDCVWQPAEGGVKILEINCDYPDGLILHDNTVAALTGTAQTTHQTLLTKLFAADELVSVLHHQKASFRDGYYAEHQLLNAPHRPGLLTSTVEEIPPAHTIRRCLETSKLSAEALCQLGERDARIVNTIALRTLGYKDLLATLTHPFVPETITLSATTRPRLLAEPERWIIKPVEGCEGVGIHIGAQESPAHWEQVVRRASETMNYIAQEYVPLPKTRVALYDEGTIVTREVYYDLCPHFFIHDQKIVGRGHTLVRYSTNPIVNVSQGGGIGYYKA